MLRKVSFWVGLPLVLVLAMSAMLVGCGSDSDHNNSESDKQEITDLATTLASTDGSTATEDQIAFYLSHITDSFLQDFGTPSIEACRADAATCIGTPLSGVTIDPATVEVDGDTGKLVIVATEGSFGFQTIKEDGVWKANGIYVPNDEIPTGADVIDINMKEFAFEGTFDSDTVKSGDFAIHAKNTGQQNHELVLVPLPPDRPIEDILQDQTFQPDPVFVKFAYSPGDESDVALDTPLDPGRYAFVCFLPDTTDEEMTPHAFKGMVAEFTVE